MRRFVLLCLFILLVGCSGSDADEVCFNNTCFQVEIVGTEESRVRGLQFRESLSEDSGMLFIFEEDAVYPFWMKNTIIALDIIWMDRSGEIVDIMPDLPPCRMARCPVYTPGHPALYVLEINAGTARVKGLRPGDKAVFR